MTTIGAPRALLLDSLSSELRSSIPYTSNWPRESTSQVTPIEALSCLGTNVLSVFTGASHLAVVDGMFGGLCPYGWFSLNSSRPETRLDPLLPVFTLDLVDVPPEMS